MADLAARRWIVRGRVQGVGFRFFVEANAKQIGLNGWVRNQDDSTVLAYAVGTEDQLDQLAAALHQGPRMAEVRGVQEERLTPVQEFSSFRVM